MRPRLSLCVLALALLGVQSDAQVLLRGVGLGHQPGGAASPLLTNLVASWDLDEASGNAIDAHDDNDLTETSGTIAQGAGPGGVGNARDFELGDTEYFTLADNADLSIPDANTSFTIVAWVNLETDATTQAIVSKYTGLNLEYEVNYNSGSAKFVFNIASGASFANFTGVAFGNVSTAGNWYMVSARHDATGNTIDINVNAGTPASTAYTHGAWDSSSPFWIGSNSDNQYADARIAQVRLWKRVLTDGEVTWLYNSGNGRSYADIVTCSGC